MTERGPEHQPKADKLVGTHHNAEGWLTTYVYTSFEPTEQDMDDLKVWMEEKMGPELTGLVKEFLVWRINKPRENNPRSTNPPEEPTV